MIDADREWLETGGSRSTVVRPEIVSSWRRSRLSGVSPDVVSILPGEAPLDCKIARVAVPILGAMAEVLIGANTSLLLSAPDGTMLWRWSEDSRLSALLDRNSAVVGTRWSEDVVGTNGLGTALETVQPITIHGPEHFSESLHPFTCAGAPIRHPITRRVAGTLSVTSLTKDASPLMVATLKKLAREVEEQLYGDSTLRERELLHHFLTERRRADSAVVVVNSDTVIANKAGVRLGIDHRSLWNQVETVKPGAGLALDLSDHAEEISWRTIEHAGSVVGLVIVADEPGSREAVRPRRRERSTRVPHWAELPGRLRQAAAGCDRLLVTGEAGTGKRTLLQETFGSQHPMRELDCAEAEEVGSKQWLAAVRSMLVGTADGTSGPVLLSHLESLTVGLSRSLGRILDALPRTDDLRVAATWTPTGTEPGPALQSLLDRFASEPFEIPPLRKRPRDIHSRLLHQGPTMPVLSTAATELVERHPWPGNHRQLEEFRRWLGRQARPTLDVTDLPPRWSRDAARARLTAIQAAEADAINAALQTNNGNKAAAAAELGISRSSLYRKMREYHLV